MTPDAKKTSAPTGSRLPTKGVLRGLVLGAAPKVLAAPKLLAALCLTFGVLLLADGFWIKGKAILAQLLLDRALVQAQAGSPSARPWPWADIAPMGRLHAPRLGANAVVLASSSGEALAFGPGWVDGSAQPGQPGLAVLAGHRDTHFAFLQHLQPGDELSFTGLDRIQQRYQITHTEVVKHDRSGLRVYGAGSGLVLSTCWPFNSLQSTELRYLVHAEPLETPAPPPFQALVQEAAAR